MSYLTDHCDKPGACQCRTCALAPGCHICPCKGVGPGPDNRDHPCNAHFAQRGCDRYEQTDEARVEENMAVFEAILAKKEELCRTQLTLL